MQLDEALAQIDQIRSQIARTETFRGYRSATVGFSGLAGIAAAVVQSRFIPNPEQQFSAYLALWIGVAALSVLVVGAELSIRCRRATSPTATRLTRLAIEQFFPCLAAGALLTFALALAAPESVWMLPGLWAIVFSLGVFASYRLIPRPGFLIGVYYLFAGGICLLVGRGDYALSPWLMAGAFGGGQLLTAAVLYWTLERCHESC
jgi:hypothetical protein